MTTTFYEFPLDAELTTDSWDRMRELISEELRCCEVKGGVNPKDLPFFSYFEVKIQKKLLEAGFKKSIIENKKRLEAIVKNLDMQGIGNAYLWTKNGIPYGFPFKVVTFDEKNKKLYWVDADIEAAIRGLKSLTTMKELFVQDGIVDRNAVKIYLHSLEMIINILRAGNVPKKAIQGERLSVENSKKAKKERNSHGITPEERAKRDREIRNAFKKSKLTQNGFAIKYQKKYNLSITQIKKIIKSQVDT